MDMSEHNHPEEARLPQVMEVYDMQMAGLVGQASFSTKGRPATLDGADLFRHDMRMDEAEGPKFGLLPSFGEQSVGMSLGGQAAMQRSNQGTTDALGAGGFGSFRPKQGFAPVKKVPPVRTKGSGRDARSPSNMGPWGAENMERAFDPSATAPGYRPNKVIRSLDDSFRSKKPRAKTVNPRLNAVEVTMMRTSPEVSFDNEVMQLSGGYHETEHDPLLHFDAGTTES